MALADFITGAAHIQAFWPRLQRLASSNVPAGPRAEPGYGRWETEVLEASVLFTDWDGEIKKQGWVGKKGCGLCKPWGTLKHSYLGIIG